MAKPKTSNDLFRGFLNSIKAGQFTLSNVTEAYRHGHVVRRDLGQVYSALFLQGMISFETLVEDLFLHLCCGTVEHPRPCAAVHVFPNPEIALRIIARGKYVDWMPFDRTIKLSKIFFEERGNPFIALTSLQISELNSCYKIRNYIAHQSKFSSRVFHSDVIGPLVLPKRKSVLLGYLEYPHTQSVTKFEYHIGEVVNAARTLCT